jgi:hypothetical protein
VLLSGSKSLLRISSSPDAMLPVCQPLTYQICSFFPKELQHTHRDRGSEKLHTLRRRKFSELKFIELYKMSGDIQERRMAEGQTHIQAAEK